MLLTGAILPILLIAAPLPQQTQTPADQAPVGRRVAASAQLAAQEYRVGVVNGRVVAKAEVEEATLFLQEARRSAALLPAEAGQAATADLDALLRLVGTTAPPDSLDSHVRSLGDGLARRLGITLDELPALTPSLS